VSDGPIGLESDDQPEPPPLPGRVVAVGDEEAVAGRLLGDLLTEANDAVGEVHRFDLAISGSRLLEPLWRRFMVDPDVRGFPWGATHLWLLDGDLKDSAWLQEAFVWPAGVPVDHVHPGRLRPEEGQKVHASVHVVEPGGRMDTQGLGAADRAYLFKPAVASLASLEQAADVIAALQGSPAPGTLRWYLTLP